MGQQQLLLIVLGVIIVGIAVAVGINMFSSSAIEANRDAVTSDITLLSSKAQQHFKKPTSMGGGGNDFDGFAFGALDTVNSNGQYRVTGTLPTSSDLVVNEAAVPVYASISAPATTIYVVGYSRIEKGRDNTNLIMAFATVTASAIDVTILN